MDDYDIAAGCGLLVILGAGSFLLSLATGWEIGAGVFFISSALILALGLLR